MSKPTSAQLSALKWLVNRGGDGVFGERGNHTVLLAMGERAPIMRGTWSKLEKMGLVESYGHRRLRVTTRGMLVNLSKVEESRGNE